MKENVKNNVGITLIALIITIIILLILAGVAIHFTLGENGILRNAELAGNKYKEASENETNMLDQIYAYMNGKIKLKPNTPETLAGTPVEMPNNWFIHTPDIYQISESAQKEVRKSERTANVYAVSDGQNNTIPIPYGFYYVGGNLNSGVVISDNARDQNKYKNEPNGVVPSGIKVVEENGTKKLESELQGNQFVWIPCTEEDYHKDSWGKANDGNMNYGYWDPTTNSSELPQIRKYGGFYVGRYEACLPEGTEEYTDALSYNNEIYNYEGVPEIKAGRIPWFYVSWENSQKNARKMYENKESISSGLITGTQWDVMINKIASIDETKSLTDSKSWGNYKSSEFTYTGRASEFLFSNNKQYPFGEIEVDVTKEPGECKILTTGASNHNRAYNIYDVAGNLSEWVEEAGVIKSVNAIQTNHEQRGGDSAHDDPVCIRDVGEYSPSSNFTFRVVLYIR